MGVEPWSTEQGVAGLAQVNFLGPYTLTRRLAPQLLEGRGGAGGRVVNVASVMHRFSQLPPEPHLFLKDWWRGGAYRCCKLANVVFTLLLEQQRERLAAQGRPGITALAVDPGAVYSGIWATSRWLGRPPGSWVLSSLFAPPADAAATSFHAAAAKEVQGGQYFARGLFASPAIVQGRVEAASGLLSCVDWPLRQLSGGRLAADIAAVEVAEEARAVATDGRGVALWDAAAELAGLSSWASNVL
ncbi:hypothetical protein V8C86DRAFT_2499468 [Haematococcus lacustris]